MRKRKTIYGVYIIEFLRSEDYTDGLTLFEILELSKIPAQYEWADTVEDFKRLLEDFDKSGYRYLHISCHADKCGLEINGDEISNSQFQLLTQNILNNKRLFLSACNGGNRKLASEVIAKNKAYSLIGVPVKLSFDKSALFWPSFYHLIAEVDFGRMKRHAIIETIKKCVSLFNIPINYYSRINNSTSYMRRLKISQGHTDNRKIKVTK